jgi:regulator of sigma E protease
VTGVNIFTFVLVLIALVLVHEAGHMVVAKWCGMKVERFSVFFGRPIWSFRRGETEYAIGWLPLGGYVKITGMSRGEEMPPEDVPRAYFAQATWKKVATILAGPGVNAILAFVIFAVVAWIGPTLIVNANPVQAVAPGSPAAQAGLLPGDELLAVNGVRPDGESLIPLQLELREHPSEVVTVTFRHDSRVLTRRVRLLSVEAGGERIGRLGVDLSQTSIGRDGAGPIEGIQLAGRYTSDVVTETVKTLASFVTSSEARGQLSSVAGIGATYNEVAREGPLVILQFVGLISLALAIFNLLPLLPLDGGHILFALIEKLKGSPLRREAYERASMIGIALILLVFVFALQNDISRFSDGGFGIR